MPITINLSREDVQAARVLPPGWYLCTIKDVWQEPAKSDGSTNTWVKFAVKEEGDFKDVPLRKNFSEKWMNPIIGLIEVLSGKAYVAGTPVELDGAKGKDIRVQVQNKLYNGTAQNEVIGFKPA